MGRGRAKAKQTKVARDLKYRTHETDFGALARELHGDESEDQPTDQVDDQVDESVDDSVDSVDSFDGLGEYDKWSDYSESRSD